jgi:putative flippase GtrA
MTLGKHARGYLIIGGLQWVVDCAVLMLLTHYGMEAKPANILGRVAGALLGYWLNGRFTFAGEDSQVGSKQLVRFILMWLGTTVISTWAIGAIDDNLGLTWAWFAKPAVEAFLGLMGFLLSRHWVYNK